MLKYLIAILIAMEVLLIVSGYGILVKSDINEVAMGTGQLSCTYFIGTGTADQTFVYQKDGIMGGKQACPRLYRIAD